MTMSPHLKAAQLHRALARLYRFERAVMPLGDFLRTVTITPEQFAHPAEAGAHAGCARFWRNFDWSPAWEEAKPSIASPAIETAGARP